MMIFDSEVERIKFKNCVKKPTEGIKVKIKTGHIGILCDWEEEQVEYRTHKFDDLNYDLRVKIVLYTKLLIHVEEKYPGEIGVLNSGFFNSEEVEVIE